MFLEYDLTFNIKIYKNIALQCTGIVTTLQTIRKLIDFSSTQFRL